MNKIQLIFTKLINISFYLVTKLIPKKKNLWVFGGWFGNRYSDNPKAFFEYINNEQQHIEAVWVCKDEQVITHIKSLGFKAFHEKSMAGIWCQLRAKFAFVCQSLHDDIYAPCIGKRTKVVNLWHGLPLKKIMYDVFGNKVMNKNLIGKIFDKLSPYEKIRNDYLLATSEETQHTLCNAFRLPKERTLITGFPRNDVFLKPSNQTQTTKNNAYKCIYMPTFRGGIGAECDLFAQYGFNVKTMDTQLAKNNIELVLRMHPVNKPPKYIIEEIKSSSNISIDSTADIFDSIIDYDCMVTDYSGGYFDFLLTGRPILFAPFDLEKYKQQERDLYYKYEDVTLRPYAYNWAELIENIVSVKQGNLPESYTSAYKALQQKFHTPIGTKAANFSDNLYQIVNKL
jgi:CDP-glycerol glycerophosphotransferase